MRKAFVPPLMLKALIEIVKMFGRGAVPRTDEAIQFRDRLLVHFWRRTDHRTKGNSSDAVSRHD